MSISKGLVADIAKATRPDEYRKQLDKELLELIDRKTGIIARKK